MKKKLLIGLTITGAVFGGFLIAQTTIGGSAETNDVKKVATTTKTAYISEQEAKNIALKTYDGTIVEMDYDKDDLTPHYDFEIRNNNEEVDVEVNAETGEAVITNRDTLDDDDNAAKTTTTTTTAATNNSTATETKSDTTTNTTTEKKTVITKAAAIKAASTVAKGTVTKVELDDDDDNNTLIYELEFKDGNVEYDVEVNAYTGKVISVDQDIDD